MDIDSLISGAHMRRKTTMGAVRINFTSEKEENSVQLERHSKGRVDLVHPIARVVEPLPPIVAGPSPIFPTSSSISLDEDSPPPTSHVSPSEPIVEEAPVEGDRG